MTLRFAALLHVNSHVSFMAASRIACVASSLLAMSVTLSAEDAKLRRPNVLFIAVDDLKPALGCYGDRLARTPNIDRLAARGTVFDRAYCMQAVCAPSRNALLTGLRPETLRIYDLGTNFRRRAPDVVTLPQHFKSLGYETHGLGKIFHVGHGNHEDPVSWSVPHFQAKTVHYLRPENKAVLSREEALFANQSGDVSKLPKGAAYEHADVPDDAYADGAIATEAIKRLQGFKEAGKPFFLAVGFLKPHLPFCAPQKYWDLHDPTKLPLPDRRMPPDDAPPFAPQFGGELRNYAGIPNQGAIPDELARTLIHGYLAASSYMDAQLGRVLDELDRLSLAENTVIVLWGDHGWHLGDHGIWCKHTNYEQATRAPLIFAAPGKTGGQHTAAFAEFVDVYPTLCELAGIPQPEHLQGESLVPFLDAPDAAGKRAAFQVYPRRTPETGPLLGHAVRTDRWRYVEWRKTDQSVAARELYDMQDDPGETKNIAAQSEHAETVDQHAKLLAARLSVPPPTGLKLNDLAQKSAQPAVASQRSAGQAKQSPHIILILTDDMGIGDLGCYGGTLAPTPNLDRLAQAGTRFTHYYSAAPICSPSRAGIITGMFPARWRITSFLQTRAGNRECEQLDFLDPNAPSLPRRLKRAGYTTAHFGKWHLGGGRDVTDAPKLAAYGYDEHASTWESPEPHPEITATNWIWSNEDQVKRWERTGFFVEKTLDFLRRHKETKACFINLWLDDVHTPWVPSDDAPKGDTRANLKPVLTELDRQIGRLLDGLRELGIEQETLVIFTSDNGALPTFNGARSGGLRASKLSLYEGGIRMPFIVRWPARVPAGRIDEETLISAVDLFPTLMAVANAGLPTGVDFDGEDMSTALFGTPLVRRSPLFWEYGRNDRSFRYPPNARDRSPAIAVREGPWKLLVNTDGSRTELYNVVADPAEQLNEAEQQPEITRRLRDRALDWHRSLPKPDSQGSISAAKK